MFLAVSNLTEQAAFLCEPWTFTPAEKISAQIRGDKVSRQQWYQSPSTKHLFYGGVIPANDRQRVSKSNPPAFLNAAVCDFDLPIPETRWREVIEKMKIKPQWVEKSLGGNIRLVFIFAKPIPLHSESFAVFVLQSLRQWLALDTLPGLDGPALGDPARLYCAGDSWTQISAEPVSELASQAFFVKCGRSFAFKGEADDTAIPLDIVERALAARYPNFCWPGAFELESTGPSFWLEGSTSPTSAIVKAGGIFSFAAHAQSPFTPWSVLLGTDFAAKWHSDAIAAATKNIFFDGKLFWKENTAEGCYVSMSREALQVWLKVSCRVSSKADKSGTSAMEQCLNHIQEFARVEGGAPLLFLPPGKRVFCGRSIVNTAPRNSLVRPSGAAEPKFPFIQNLLDNLFDPPAQRDAFCAWVRHFYLSALAQKPEPGQCVFIAGGPGVGKTLLNREVLGGLVGAHVDASRFLLGEEPFNSSLFFSALWCVDDTSVSSSEAAHRKFSSAIKSFAANSSWNYNKKYESNLMIPFCGRVLVTLNLDADSSRSLVAVDSSILDKVSFFRAAATPTVVFPKREVIQETLRAELPEFAQWLTQWQVPEELLGESRFGVKAYHEPSLLDKSHQAGRSSSFKELMLDFLIQHFAANPKATEWRGSVTQIMRAISFDPMNEHSIRGLKLEQVSRHLEVLAKEGVVNCRVENGSHKVRLWVFGRIE